MMPVRLFQDERIVGVLNMYLGTHNTTSTDSQAVARMFAPYAAAAYIGARKPTTCNGRSKHENSLGRPSV